MSGVNGKIDINVNATYDTAADFGTPTFKAAFTKQNRIVAGTTATNQADLMFADNRVLSASTSENLDLNGALIDVFGNAIAFAEVTYIYIENGGTTDITVGGAASNAFVGPFGAATHTVTLKAGEVMLITNSGGWTVTPATGDILKVANGAGGSGNYNIILVGRSVAA